MCALCAVLGSSNHWADMAGRDEFNWNGNKITRRFERNRRVSLMMPVLDYYGLSLGDCGGSTYILSDQAGRSEEVYQLDGIWATAEKLAGKPCDPLDRGLIQCLLRSGAD